MMGLTLGACGGTTTTTAAPTPSASASAAVAEAGTGTDGGPALGKGTRVASAELIERRQKNALAPDTIDETGKSAPPPKTSAEIYKAAAPATVVVRVGGGLGSGIVIDPAGWILTNHHVVQGGKTDDFKHKATILMGRLNPATGAMERLDEEYEAYVHQHDKLRDIALLKLTKPPDKPLPFVRVAEAPPLPGSDVVALGHAGAGMLWALKSGQISALGKLSETLSQLASFKDDEDGREMAEKFKKFVESKNLGLVIQSTCNILPGDSGGPLLNDRAELIGLNVFARRDRTTGGLLSFHVHRDELRKFADTRPASPAQMIPEPWDEGGGDIAYEDADLDGKVDVLMMTGRKPCSFCPPQSRAAFIDADQDSYANRSRLPDLEEVYDLRDFDAEVIYLQVQRDAFIWYDRDNDGSFDLLLYEEGGPGHDTVAFTLDDAGVATRDASLSGGKAFQLKLVEAEPLRARVGRVSRAAFPESLTTGPATATTTTDLPAPFPVAGRIKPRDLDRSGVNDALAVATAFSNRLLVDADENFVPGLKEGDEFRSLEGGRPDAEMVFVNQSGKLWTYYDQDDDGAMDLVLYASGSRLYVAEEAYRIADGKPPTPAPEHLGRMLVRPRLLSTPGVRGRVEGMVGKGILPIMSSEKGDGRDSFPHPIDDHRGTRMTLRDDIKAFPKTVVVIAGYGSDGYLLDLDRSSGLFGAAEAIDIADRIDKGRFDPEMAYFHRNGMAWWFYDTDDDADWDVVLVATKLRKGVVDAAYRIGDDDEVTFDASLVGGAPVRPSLFNGARLSSALKRLGPELFSSSLVE